MQSPALAWTDRVPRGVGTAGPSRAVVARLAGPRGRGLSTQGTEHPCVHINTDTQTQELGRISNPSQSSVSLSLFIISAACRASQ